MGKKILYGKIGRSMPLTLDKCGVAGGDQEMTAVVTALAKRHPEDQFILIGRNSGEYPPAVGLPPNVINPWFGFGDEVKRELAAAGLKGNFSPDDQRRYAEIVDEYTLPIFEQADAIVMWAGQHGTTNNPLPKVEDRSVLTKPQDSFVHYAGFLLRGINHWRDLDPINREEIWLNADPRNYLKMRDLKWPLRHPVLAQFDYQTNIKHERYGAGMTGFDQFHWSGNPLWEYIRPECNGQVWRAKVQSIYSRLELNLTVPGTPSGDYLEFNDSWGRKHDFGIVINEARAIGVRPEMTRLHAMKKWVLPLAPGFIHGTWSLDGLAELYKEWNGDIKPIEWRAYTREIQTARCTFTTPSSGSGWATTKPWESFALGTVCFFHPDYDTQNHILHDAHPKLQEWLRVKTPGDLKARVDFLGKPEGRAMWEWLVVEQRKHYEKAVANPTYLQLIEHRIYGSHL